MCLDLKIPFEILLLQQLFQEKLSTIFLGEGNAFTFQTHADIEDMEASPTTLPIIFITNGRQKLWGRP